MSNNHHKKNKKKNIEAIFFFQNIFNAGQTLQKPYKKERDKEKINSHY